MRNEGYASTTVEVTVGQPLLADTTTLSLEPGDATEVLFSIVANTYQDITSSVTLTSTNEILQVQVHVTVEPDSDGDGFDATATGGDDCDDTDDQIHPGAIETCDGVDEDCNDVVDDSDDARFWYRDADLDSFGVDDDSVQDCRRPSGYAARGGDCDDGDNSVYPGAPEVHYDGVDSNCDNLSDYDADLDGFDAKAWGGPDCADNDDQVHPDMIDTWYDGVDSDCDNHSDFDADDDGVASDQYGGTDCDDTDPSINPSKPELLDGIDQDCDILVDEDYFVDGDLIICEVMLDPSAAGGQYVELYNDSPRSYEILGLTLNNEGIGTVFSSDIVLTGETRVWCADMDPSVNGGVNCDGVLSGPLVSGLFEVLVGQRVLDDVDTTGWAIPAGAAIELSSDALDHEDNDLEAAWCAPPEALANGDLGNPGAPGSGACP